MRKLMACLVALVATTTAANGAVIVQNLGGNEQSNSGFAWGQSFITPNAPQSWNNVTFSFFSDVPPTSPVAFGQAFLLSSPYAGTPAGLSAATPGFLATSTGISGGQYVFDPTFILNPNTTYYLYTNAVLNGSLSGNNNVAGTAYYAAFGTSSNFANFGNDINYRVSGTPTPEPISLIVFGGLIVGGAGVALRRRMKAAA